jgi:chemotaxis protein CheX
MIDLERPLIEITRTVWKCMFGLEVSPTPVSAADAGDALCRSTVTLDGAWSGALDISCPAELARSVAAIFHGLPRADVAEADLLDALGEIANMTGGNLKAVLPGPCHLSTPRSGSGPAPAPKSGALRLAFACGLRRFTVELSKEDRA